MSSAINVHFGDKVALVTGSSRNLGKTIAQALGKRGSQVAVHYVKDRDGAERTVDSIRSSGGVAELFQADIARADDVRRLTSELLERFGRVDILVNNAGLAHYMPFAELPPERARELLEVNVCGPVLLTRAAIPGMIERGAGAIINVASLLAFSGDAAGSFMPHRAVYAATKSFIVTFTQILAQELEPHGVRVQVLCPGVVRSEFHTRQGMDLSEVARMEPDDVVLASLQDLEDGVVVSVPGLADPEALARVSAANGQMLGATRVKELPPRYAGARERRP